VGDGGFAVVVVDRLPRVVALAGGLDVFGAAAGDIVGLSLEDLVEGDGLLVWGEPVRGALSGREAVFVWATPDGRALTVRVAPLGGRGDGAFWAVASCVEAVEGVSMPDVEVEVEVEVDVGASGALYRAVTRNLPDTAVTVFDRDLRFRMAYGEALALNGWTSEETEGRTPRELMPKALADELEPLFRAALRGARSTVELRSLHGERTLWTRIAPVIGADVPAGVAISVDITERREAEEAGRRLAAIVEQSGDAILAIDRDGTITAWNRGAERLLGYETADATGRTMLSVVPKDRGEEDREVLGQVLDGATITYESQRLRADRTMIDVSVTASPIRDVQGGMIAVSAILRDVTESKLLEQRLRHLATHDPLTGLLNRGAFDGELERSIAFARRFESAAALVLLDIDHLTGWWKCLTAVLWKRMLCWAQRARNASLWVESSPTRVRRRAGERVPEVQLDRLDAAIAGFIGDVETLGLPATRLRVIEQHRPLQRRPIPGSCSSANLRVTTKSSASRVATKWREPKIRVGARRHRRGPSP
jgi:PAS domain S-box-containing protein